VVETHISWVLLTGEWAYKIKKPVNLGFLDFSTLELRRHFCEEELRLNRRLAPEIYESVVEIRGTPEAPLVGGSGPLLDYAVKMREFPQETLADRMLARGELTPQHIDRLAERIFRFHAAAPIAGPALPYGSPQAVIAAARQNFEQLYPHLPGATERAALRWLEMWTEFEQRALCLAFCARRQEGLVRECHGDLHLGNIAILDGVPVIFDCIEFSDTLRWIDVMNEIAFVLMDLRARRRADLAWRLLNRYLENTGDYTGLAVLRFYMVYRALVRAKVSALRACEPGVTDATRKRLAAEVGDYIGLARDLATEHRPALLITHGVSGSGKTSATQSLVEAVGAVRIRSDIERKRLYGLGPLARSGAGLNAGIYAPGSTRVTYMRLYKLAREIIGTGRPVLVDATFLKAADRERFRALAACLEVPFVILDFHAPLPVLRERILRRQREAADASEADTGVLESQLAGLEPLTPEEAATAIRIDTQAPVRPETWQPVLARLESAVETPRPVERAMI
jgi:aminoglycoside phosphotransferase family enzyme/predicted kinase